MLADGCMLKVHQAQGTAQRDNLQEVPASFARLAAAAAAQGQLARLTEFIGSDAEFWQSGLLARLQSRPLDGLQPPGQHPNLVITQYDPCTAYIHPPGHVCRLSADDQ